MKKDLANRKTLRKMRKKPLKFREPSEFLSEFNTRV